MAKSCINIKRCNVLAVEEHNLRVQDYLSKCQKNGIYIFQDLTKNNQNWVNPQYEGLSCKEIQDKLVKLYQSKIGQKPNLKDRVRINKKTGKEMIISGWSPIKEGIIVLDENTTMSQIQSFAEQVKDKWHINTIRIDMHFDEGYEDPKTKERKLNRHAHIVFDWVDHKTGKTYKLDKDDMIKMQDMLANCLNMERGVSAEITKLKHIDHKKYKSLQALMAEKEQLEELINKMRQDLEQLQH